MVVLCFMNISFTNGYHINDRTLESIGHGPPKSMSNKTTASSPSSVNIDSCIPVYAVKEVGCLLSEDNIFFQGSFQSICERHQLCYACGFAHGITERLCNKITLMNMNDLCFRNKSLSQSDCMRESFSKLSILQQYGYRSFSDFPGYLFECRQDCVYTYLRAH
ncbi:unnamed protein product [Rotaria sp. Silwood2]|nr:unnamed protein product [Rotaria sp. Silwood2]CAF2670394.1 unnamed protein product [Rotaria sp. Silwood2]CAF3134684.1 unnamed protein product [Rotaria sp. Silwood2]CAF4039736.1 unnamed protein product [Rotaria sp. Silwood2]CAF4378264.1 unnamed protein product [Rotaria sp. Silwood2]